MITIDPEFESLIPPLSEDEYRQLEQNCIKEGIRDALIVWPQQDGSNILVDGHNRWKIAADHGGLPFQVKQMAFQDREEAKAWIIRNQFGRRNLSAYDRSVLALKLKPMIQAEARKRQNLGLKSDEGGRTDKQLAEIAKVGKDTIRKVEAIEKSNDEHLKEQVRSGGVSIDKAYQKIKSELDAAKRRISELENREPEIREVKVEVPPADYGALKKEIREARRDAQRAEQDYESIRKKWMDSQDKVRQLESIVGADKVRKDADRDVRYFTDATNDYIRRYGGHVWVFNEFQNLDETLKRDFIDAIRALDSFAQQIINNLGGGLNE